MTPTKWHLPNARSWVEPMIKLVWDSSAIANIKEPDERGYSPAYSLWKDLADGWIVGPYENIIPAVAVFEVNNAVSRNHARGRQMLREFYLMGGHERIYPIDEHLIQSAAPLFAEEGFKNLRGADLIFACIAKIEGACLVTLDNHFEHVSTKIDVLNLNASRDSALYRSRFPMASEL